MNKYFLNKKIFYGFILYRESENSSKSVGPVLISGYKYNLKWSYSLLPKITVLQRMFRCDNLSSLKISGIDIEWILYRWHSSILFMLGVICTYGWLGFRSSKGRIYFFFLITKINTVDSRNNEQPKANVSFYTLGILSSIQQVARNSVVIVRNICSASFVSFVRTYITLFKLHLCNKITILNDIVFK